MKVQSPSSNYKGVSWNITCQKWLVHVRGQHVGVFESEKEAAYAYNIRAKQDFGAFVKLNEIQFDKNDRLILTTIVRIEFTLLPYYCFLKQQYGTVNLLSKHKSKYVRVVYNSL